MVDAKRPLRDIRKVVVVMRSMNRYCSLCAETSDAVIEVCFVNKTVGAKEEMFHAVSQAA